MGRHYLNPSDASDPYKLSNVECFYAKAGEWAYDESGERREVKYDDEGELLPGCMPDSEPDGPYETEEKAIEACRELHGEDE